MKTKQSEVSEKADARLGERYAATKKLILVIGMMLSGAVDTEMMFWADV